jgi:hypothetical protein
MRTLIDLLNDANGYVRIYAEQTGFGYERSTYSWSPSADLFDRMTGYANAASAREAARLQLLATPRAKRRRRRI